MPVPLPSPGHGAPLTQRGQAKENRRQALLAAAATLFARDGFNRVSIEDLGAAAGVSGPAVYRHFQGKQALLGALLLTVSRELLAGGEEVISAAGDGAAALRGLIAFQVDFALNQLDVIRVQDRDFNNLAPDDQFRVRQLQRQYVELWVEVLAAVHPSMDDAELRMRAHAAFGLINSTPHSVRTHGRRMGTTSAGPVLERMAYSALTVP